MRHRDIEPGVIQVEYISIGPGKPQKISAEIVEEGLSCISVNGQELATFMCTPTLLEELAIGFLYNEGFVQRLEEIESVYLSKKNCVDIWIKNFIMPEKAIVTTGCGGGLTFDDLTKKHKPLEISFKVKPSDLANLMRQTHLGANLYRRSRGIHTAALADLNGLILQVEDVGRHNCIDKLAGVALRNGIQTHGRILLSSGRISSEMINKARRLGTPIVCSRTSPTSLSVALAESWGITIAAYLRQERMRIYSNPRNIVTETILLEG